MNDDLTDDISMMDFGFDDLDDVDDLMNDMNSILDAFKKIEIINANVLFKDYDFDIFDESCM